MVACDFAADNISIFGENVDVEVLDFGEISEEFHARVRKMIWCNMATVDAKGRPRSRIVHPVWDGLSGYAVSRPESFKAKHLARSPWVSLAYVADLAQPLYVDCSVAWEQDPGEKQRVWQLIATTQPPYGFDPAPMFGGGDATSPAFGLLRFTPWRVQLGEPNPADVRVWHAPNS